MHKYEMIKGLIVVTPFLIYFFYYYYICGHGVDQGDDINVIVFFF